MFKSTRIKKNTETLLTACRDLITSAEVPTEQSCVDELIPLCRRKCEAAKEEVANYNDQTDYKKLAAILVANFSFNLLASGKFHVYRGMLDPVSCANNMMRAYKAAMNYGCSIGFITQTDVDDQLDYLHELISEVG